MSDHIGITVCVDHSHDRETELVRFGDGDVLLLGVDHKDGVGKLVEGTDATEVALELLELTSVAQGFLFGHAFEVAGLLHGLELLHALHAGGDRLEVRKHAAQPPLVHVRHATGICVHGNGALGLLLGAYEKDGPTTGDQVAHVAIGLLDALEGLTQVDQVDPVALTKDESAHLGVPPASLVSKVDTGAQQLLHRDDGHVAAPCNGSNPWPLHPVKRGDRRRGRVLEVMLG